MNTRSVVAVIVAALVAGFVLGGMGVAGAGSGSADTTVPAMQCATGGDCGTSAACPTGGAPAATKPCGDGPCGGGACP